DLERLLERRAVDDIEAEQLLLGLSERPVDHQRRLPVLPDRGRDGGRHEPGGRPELALLGEPLVHDIELGHDGVVLLLGPGIDDVFIVVAADGVEHSSLTLFPPQAEGAGRRPTPRLKKRASGSRPRRRAGRVAPALRRACGWWASAYPIGSTGFVRCGSAG